LSADEVGNDEGVNLYLYVGNSPIDSRDPTGFYKLKGFPPEKIGDMDKAINDAINRLKADCPSCAGPDGPKIVNKIQNATFVFKPDWKKCGQVGPLTFLRLRDRIGIGPNAWNCGCPLASVIAHESMHALTHLQGKANQIERDCFGCNPE
jgi:hypothetical protein